MKRIGAIALSVAVVSTPALAGPDWIEQADAGPTYGSAQRIVGIGVPHSISGTLSAGLVDPDFEDVYIIRIDQPSTFSFSMQNAGFDSQLYLFNITLANELFGLLANNDASNLTSDASISQPFATDGSGAKIAMPGVYALAITGAGRYPVGLNGAIFSIASPTELSGPDGPGGINALSGWQGAGQTGGYEVELEGTGYVDVPAPGVAGLLGAVGLVALRRRR